MENRVQNAAPFKAGDFIMLKGGDPLEVVYADDEKAVCLRLYTDHAGGWSRTGETVAISNRAEDYQDAPWLQTTRELKITGRCRWKIIKAKMSFSYQ